MAYMQDIQRKKPKVIDLRKNKKPVQIKNPVKVVIETKEENIEPAKPKEWDGIVFPCVDCGLKEAQQELERCRSCDTRHKEIATRLDSHPRAQQLERPPVQATYRKEASQGVIVTIQRLEPLQ